LSVELWPKKTGGLYYNLSFLPDYILFFVLTASLPLCGLATLPSLGDEDKMAANILSINQKL
jgi:hypothetical protein